MSLLLLINPNTSEAVTRQLAQAAAALTPAGGQVLTRTARFGMRYISSEYALALASHAVLDAYDTALSEGTSPNVVLLGCFGDPGLLALRERARVPVCALAEASMREAVERGRYAIVTGGAAWVPMLRRLAWSLDLLDPLAGIVSVEPSGAELAADPEMAGRVLRQACQQAAALPGVASIIVGGAALAGWAARLQPEFALPLLDSVDCGLRSAWHMTCV
ncbi:aspartate/glutamate racemase family protein [Paucibacter sp. PLA-PC-4]|uniref:aspartate/glutamate racemase family protein n=1 Tax=Paucibacter sp. PLA-PC-4 TaxID=2993655 RepID=UPI00224B9453|nr:aspartate/glutamate racemase family protein [Paucibacter sp. PLA-PC-4]MCX2863805.1 aspartate/glutamate racemase family protein [Paucibacter sp. PLA-PC-4]